MSKVHMFDKEEILGMVFKGQPLVNVTIGPIDLSGSNLRGAHFMGSVFDGTNLSGCDLKGANLSGADLRRATLDNAVIYHCNVYKTAFPESLNPQEILLSLKEGTRLRPYPLLNVMNEIRNLLKGNTK